MIGAIVGDIVGSRFEHTMKPEADFMLFGPGCRFTDDTVLTLAVAESLRKTYPYYLRLGEVTVKALRKYGIEYCRRGYGAGFYQWLLADDPQPYNSYGNGAAMRVSACGWVARNLKEALVLADKVTEVTHNHPEGIKGARAVSVAIFLARHGWNQKAVRTYLSEHFYPLTLSCDEIKPNYKPNNTSQRTVPEALTCALEAVSFEDAIRKAIQLNGDSDTLAAIAGSVAEVFFGVPDEIREGAIKHLDDNLKESLRVCETFLEDLASLK